MLTWEITFQTVWNAVKHQWKFMLSVVLSFVLLGVISGWYYGQRDAAPADGMAEPLTAVAIAAYDGKADLREYCTVALSQLQQGHADLAAYLKLLSAESQLREKDHLLLKEFQSKADAFPAEQLAGMEERLKEAEKGTEIGETVLGDIRAAQTALNALAEELSRSADAIAGEININLYVEYSEKGTAQVSIIHGHRENTSEEIFQVLTLFCTLVGICVGGFLTVCREALREKKEEREQRRKRWMSL